MFEINNIGEITEELAAKLMQFDVERKKYHTDVYLYIDKNGNGSLCDFINVGGNSWLNDDHFCLYTDNPHYEGYHCFNDNDIYEIIGMKEEELPEDTFLWDYLNDNPDVMEKVDKAYEEAIRNSDTDYYSAAEKIIEEFIKYRKMYEEF